MRNERFLRRAIPILILSFLTLVALVRFAGLMSDREGLESEVRRDLVVAAEFLRAQSGIEEARLSVADHVSALLTSRLPAELLEPGRFVLVSDESGTVVEAMPGWEWLEGKSVPSLMAASSSFLRFGLGTGVIDTTFNGERALAASAPLVGDMGVVMVIQLQSGYLAAWRSAVSVNVTIFALTSVILLVVLYAYIRQAGRAEDADALYLETHRLVDTALSLGHCGLWDWDIAAGKMYWSRSLYAMLGLRPREEAMCFADFADLLHPGDGNFLHLARQIASGRLTRLDRTLRLKRVDGSYLWVRARADVVRTASGDAHMIGIAVDVSDQQALAARSLAMHRQLHDAIENISETFVLCDGSDGIVLCNSKYRTIFGLTEADTRAGTHLSAIMGKCRKPIESRTVTSPTFAAGERASEVLMPDGRWLLLSERRTKDGGFISIGTDITQLKLHQARLHESERRLMAVIEDLTATRRDAERKAAQLEQLNASFMVEKTRAETASRAKTTFLANMSHELRTPLNAILGFSDIMRQGTFGPIGSPRYAEYATDIHESGHFLLRLIDDILDMAKIESGRLTLSRQCLPLMETIAESVRLVEAPEASGRITVECRACDQVKLYADKRAMKQVLLNLLSNAMKFGEDEHPVRVRVQAHGGIATISVADRGIGIPAEALSKLGRPFEQTETELTRTKKGTGLGLAIARSLVEMHGGRLRIASRLGEGTIVSIRLPLGGITAQRFPVIRPAEAA